MRRVGDSGLRKRRLVERHVAPTHQKGRRGGRHEPRSYASPRLVAFAAPLRPPPLGLVVQATNSIETGCITGLHTECGYDTSDYAESWLWAESWVSYPDSRLENLGATNPRDSRNKPGIVLRTTFFHKHTPLVAGITITMTRAVVRPFQDIVCCSNGKVHTRPPPPH